jgi:hypothetical protein
MVNHWLGVPYLYRASGSTYDFYGLIESLSQVRDAVAAFYVDYGLLES